MQKYISILLFSTLCGVGAKSQVVFPISASVSPVGANKSVQYNNASSVGAVSSVSTNDTCLVMAGAAIPSVSTNTAAIFNSSTGVEPGLWFSTNRKAAQTQPHIGYIKTSEFFPIGGGSTSRTTWGNTFTVTGTAASVLLGAGSRAESIKRFSLRTAATANSVAAVRANPIYNIGKGFYCSMYVEVTTSVSTGRTFAGVGNFTSNPDATVTLVNHTNYVAIGREGTTTNLFLYYNDGSGTASSVDLGATMPASGVLYQFELFSAPGGPVNYRVTNVANGNNANGALSSDIPSNSTLLTPIVFSTNGSSGQPSFTIGAIYAHTYY